MELRLKFGDGTLTAAVPGLPSKKFKGESWRLFDELHTRHIATLQKPVEILAQALDRPLGCYPFNETFRGSRNVLIVAPDPAENNGAVHYLPLLYERLRRLNVPNEAIRILIAKSVATPALTFLQANDYATLGGEKVRLHRHDPHDSKALEYVGITRRGTPVFVNRLILDADEVVLCGSVTHHAFAGYGGGPRLIVPGCAGHETIARHHALAMDLEALRLHPRCRDAVVEGNPLQEDAREAFRFVNASFLLHTVCNDQGQMIGAFAGEPLQAFAAACRMLDDMFLAPVTQPAPLVIASSGGFPYDSDFRRAHAALYRASQVVQPGGCIIFVAECRHGLGLPALSRWLKEVAGHAEIGALLLSGSKTLSGYPKVDWQGQQHGFFHPQDMDALIALSTLQQTQETRIIAVTALETGILKSLGFIAAASLPEALALATSCLPDIFSAFVIPNGTLLVPHLG